MKPNETAQISVELCWVHQGSVSIKQTGPMGRRCFKLRLSMAVTCSTGLVVVYQARNRSLTVYEARGMGVDSTTWRRGMKFYKMNLAKICPPHPGYSYYQQHKALSPHPLSIHLSKIRSENFL